MQQQDLPRARRVEQMAPELLWPQATHIPTSALTATSVLAAFETLTNL